MPDTEHELKQTDFGATRDAAVGDQFDIQLVEYATAGFRWEMTSDPPDAVQAVASAYGPPSSNAGGAAGMRRFHLRVARPGDVLLSFRMICPFRMADPPAASGAIRLHVTEKENDHEHRDEEPR